MPTGAEPPFDAEYAAFMQRGVSISVGACGIDRLPSVVRAIGCRISPDRRRVTLLASRIQAADVQRDIRGTGAIAVVFSEPSTHRTVQLKGTDATVTAATEADLQVVKSYCDAFLQELKPLGFEAEMIRALLACAPADVVAFNFTPCAAFSQTPGPRAGEALKVQA